VKIEEEMIESVENKFFYEKTSEAITLLKTLIGWDLLDEDDNRENKYKSSENELNEYVNNNDMHTDVTGDEDPAETSASGEEKKKKKLTFNDDVKYIEPDVEEEDQDSSPEKKMGRTKSFLSKISFKRRN